MKTNMKDRIVLVTAISVLSLIVSLSVTLGTKIFDPSVDVIATFVSTLVSSAVTIPLLFWAHGLWTSK